MDNKKSTYVYRREWNKSNYEIISVQTPRNDRIKDRIIIASKKRHLTQARYIKQAIETALTNDGVTLDTLTDRLGEKLDETN